VPHGHRQSREYGIAATVADTRDEAVAKITAKLEAMLEEPSRQPDDRRLIENYLAVMDTALREEKAGVFCRPFAAVEADDDEAK
jgi:hypothetical protein